VDAYPDVELKGVVNEVSSAADPRTGLFPAQVQLESTSNIRLASGLVANVSIEPTHSSELRYTYVPVSAIVEGEGRTASVFVVDGTTARKRLVRVGFIRDEKVALAEGLKPGERVVTEGALYLVDGERIRVVDGATGAATAASVAQ